jgi:hypothetical protein
VKAQLPEPPREWEGSRPSALRKPSLQGENTSTGAENSEVFGALLILLAFAAGQLGRTDTSSLS